MFNLIEIWRFVDSRTKIMFAVVQGVYAFLVLFIFAFVWYYNGWQFLIEHLSDRGPYILKLYLVWPTMPMLLLVWLDGMLNRKRVKENPENMEA